ncbi:MAG: HAD family phosphatase [Candidatus Diapherotrites archaeon]|nr:HAD family phosphatase [Candidatus Diapherotrites archaeon]
MDKIKGIVFDWDGVIIDGNYKKLIYECAKQVKISGKKYWRAHGKFQNEFQKGMSESKYLENISSELEIPKPKVEGFWDKPLKKITRDKPEILKLIKNLRTEKYKIGFLSNTSIPDMKFIHRKNYGLFDVQIFSCVEKTRKPEEKIYKILIKKMKLQPEEIVFIDNKQEYLDGAKKIGINLVLFKNPAQVKKELRKLGIKL